MCASYNQFQNDCGLLRQDATTTCGLTLARDKNGYFLTNPPSWQEYDDEILARQSFEGRPDYSYLPPEKEVALIMDDWRGSMGLKYADANYPYRYHYAINCDARFPNKIIAAPLAAAKTLPTPIASAATYLNLDMELTTGWTLGARSEAQAYKGTYSWMVGANVTAYQIATNWSTTWRSKVFCLSGWIYGNAGGADIAITDGTNTTTSTSITATTWTQITIKHTVAADATKLQINMHSGNLTNAYFDNIKVGSPAGGVVKKGVAFNDLQYVPYGTILTKHNSGTDAFDLVWVFPASITSLAVYNVSAVDYLYIALGDSTELWRMVAAETFTEAASECAYFLTTDTATLYGIKQAGGSELRKTTAVDTWTSVTTGGVGHTYDNQTDLFVDGAFTVIIGKEDMPYYIASGVDLPYISEFINLKSSTSCKNSFVWQGKVYIQGGDQSLFEYDGTAGSSSAIITNISPSQFMSDASDFNGAIQAITGDDAYLYIVMDNSTKIEILAGRWETVGGTTDWRWHPLSEITLTGCETAWVCNVYRKRLYLSSTTSTESFYCIPLTTKYGDITSDTYYTYQTGGAFYTPWLHANLKTDNKAYYKLTCTLGHPYDAAIYFTVSYEKWGDQLSGGVGWTSIGNFDGTLANRVETIYIPVDSASVKPVSPYIRFKFVPVTNDTSKTPILEAFDCRCVWRPAKRWLIVCTIRGDEEMVTQSGQIEKGSMANTKTVLEEAVAATWPVTFYDLDGSTIYVNFLDMRVVPSSIEPVGSGKRIKRDYLLLLQKVALS